MIVWLDHKIFGNGRGLKSPYFDDVFYWLSGELYHFTPGFGAQLSSFQWTHPRAGERRRLCGLDFVPFSSNRRLGRVEVRWSLANLPRDLDEANAVLRELPLVLGRMLSPQEGRERVERVIEKVRTARQERAAPPSTQD